MIHIIKRRLRIVIVAFLYILGYRQRFTIILKSGKEIKVFGDNLIIERRNGNDITAYEVRGGTGKLFYLSINEIAAILK